MIKDRLKKGIYFVPTLLTMGNILCGFFAIVASMNQDWLQAGIAIGVAFLLDGLDGRIARLTDTESEFGLQLDALADLVSFGMAPAVLTYTNWLYFYERLGILLAFLYVCGAALRLARFNAYDVENKSMDYFNGFPTPAAAGVVVSFYFMEHKFFILSGNYGEQLHRGFTLLVPVVVLVLSYLMISNFRYPTFKDMTWFKEHPFGVTFAMLILVFLSAARPLIVFSVFFMGYFLTGFVDLPRMIERSLADPAPETGDN